MHDYLPGQLREQVQVELVLGLELAVNANIL